MKDKLTERQQDILNFIHSFREENGYPPTLREIGKKFGISSTFGVKRHLEALVKKGYLHIESNASRGISFLREDHPSGSETLLEGNNIFNRIPIIGRVAAGIPLLAEENIEGNIVIDPSFIKKSQDCFALRVKGDSMINAGIFEGDYVIVAATNDAKSGDIVVALIDDEATVKVFDRKNQKIRLLPRNESYMPIEVKENQNFSLVGKVTGVVRYLN
jgi:repressor LexA